MVRKLFLALLVVCLSFVTLTVSADELMDITWAAGYDISEDYRPQSSIIVDGKTGEIMWQDNSDSLRDPASMSKLMTLYLVYEAIDQGKLSESTYIRATETDQAISTLGSISNNKIYAGVEYSVSDLITMALVPSSNVATIMLANHLSNNDPDAFLDMMNAKSKELGMTKSVWNNASGAGASSFNGYYKPKRYDNTASNQTTVKDMAILVYHFMKKYPAILEHTRHSLVVVMQGTPYEEYFPSYNYSLPDGPYGIEGVTGLKTGSSPRAGFNISMTIQRGEQEMIAIIMGVGKWGDFTADLKRNMIANALIEHFYATYEYRKVLDKGKHRINEQEFEVLEDVYATIPRGSEPVFVVNGTELAVKNGLESISPSIKNVVPVKNLSFSIFSNLAGGESPSSSFLTKSFNLWSSLFFLSFALISYFMFITLVGNRRRRKEQQKSRRRLK
ncbi:TPA: D-alanyl-D-alanine carboxypeptidase [Streptococcus suis]|nr:D-alanyl-D-alanine carboxypeptidase [Streptococcus suis]